MGERGLSERQWEKGLSTDTHTRVHMCMHTYLGLFQPTQGLVQIAKVTSDPIQLLQERRLGGYGVIPCVETMNSVNTNMNLIKLMRFTNELRLFIARLLLPQTATTTLAGVQQRREGG